MAGQRVPKYDWYLFYGESTDGWNFKPAAVADEKIGADAAVVREMKERPDNMVFWLPPAIYGADVSFDPHEVDPQKRFKLAYATGPDWFCGLATSPDGFAWTPDLQHPFYPKGQVSDTSHQLHFNRLTGRYQIMVRPGHGDRRVAIVESPDLRQWTLPRLVMGPDEQDSAAAQFYAMPAFQYQGLWLGLLWVMDTPPESRGGATGPMHVQLTWSYDGLNWTRGPRQPFIPIRPPGDYGHGAIEASSLVVDAQGNIRIYANGFISDHKDVFPTQEAGTPPSQLLSYSLRADGFMSLNATEKSALISTRVVTCNPSKIRVNGNFRGELKAELRDEQGKAIKGFSFNESTPVTGDVTNALLAWRGQKRVHDAVKTSVALRWTNGDLFSLRFQK